MLIDQAKARLREMACVKRQRAAARFGGATSGGTVYDSARLGRSVLNAEQDAKAIELVLAALEKG